MGRITLPLCGVVLALGLPIAAQGASDALGKADPRERHDSAGSDARVATNLSRIASALEAQNAEASPDREQRGLKAQEDMAKWAQGMFWSALLQLILSGVGIYLVYITFRETQRGAEAAQKTNLIQTDIARGRLVLTQLPIIEGNIVAYGVSNIGETTVVIHLENAFIQDDRNAERMMKEGVWLEQRIEPMNRCPLAIGKGKTEIFGRLERSTGRDSMFGGIIYSDVFGQFHLLKIALKVLPDGEFLKLPGYSFDAWDREMRRLREQYAGAEEA